MFFSLAIAIPSFVVNMAHDLQTILVINLLFYVGILIRHCADQATLTHQLAKEMRQLNLFMTRY